MKIVFLSGFDIGRFGAIMKRTFESQFGWEATNIVFNQTYIDRPGGVDIYLSGENPKKRLRLAKKAMKTADFFILRWIDDIEINYLGLDKIITAKNALFKVHGSEARRMGMPEVLVEWQTNWRYLPLTLVSCMDQTVLDRIDGKSIYHIERPFDFSLVPKRNPTRGKLILFHSPSNRPMKGTDDFQKIVSKVKGLETRTVEKVSYDKCYKERAKCHIVFDQFPNPVGTYGMAAVEAWALKMPVLVGLKSWAYSFHPELIDFAINVTPETIYHELKQFVWDSDPYYEKGNKGYRYVKLIHDPRKIALQYRALIETITRK